MIRIYTRDAPMKGSLSTGPLATPVVAAYSPRSRPAAATTDDAGRREAKPAASAWDDINEVHRRFWARGKEKTGARS